MRFALFFAIFLLLNTKLWAAPKALTPCLTIKNSFVLRPQCRRGEKSLNRALIASLKLPGKVGTGGVPGAEGFVGEQGPKGPRGKNGPPGPPAAESGLAQGLLWQKTLLPGGRTAQISGETGELGAELISFGTIQKLRSDSDISVSTSGRFFLEFYSLDPRCYFQLRIGGKNRAGNQDNLSSDFQVKIAERDMQVTDQVVLSETFSKFPAGDYSVSLHVFATGSLAYCGVLNALTPLSAVVQEKMPAENFYQGVENNF